MNPSTYLEHFRVIVDRTGAPAELRRSRGSITYKAQDMRSDSEIALEVVSPGNFSPDRIDEIEKEAAAAKEVSHMNLPRLHAFGRESDHLLYAAEYFDGTSAEDWVKTHGPMPLGPVLRIAMQVINALATATYHGVAHGAINPRNILFVPGQTAQGDWPLVKVLGLFGPVPTLTGAQFAPGEPEFAAQFASPEQFQNSPVNFRSEVYSVGATIWYLLTGSIRKSGDEFPTESELPKPVMQLLEQMLARDPEERPHDPVALEERIRTCLDQTERREAIIGRKFGTAAAAPAVTRPIEKETWTLPTWRPIAVALLALLLAGALATVLWPENLRMGRFFGSADDTIGVPIGVPEESAEAPPPVQSVATAPLPTNMAPSPNPAASGEVEAQPRQQPPPEPIVAEATPIILPEAAEASPVPKLTESKPAASPPSPGEGPGEEIEVRRAEPVIAQQAASPPRAETVDVPREEVAEAPPATEPEPARVARSSRRPKRINGLEVRAAQPVESRPTRLPKTVKRARFLGTTPDGQLVFEIPPPPSRR